MYQLDIEPSADKIFRKLEKKDKEQMRRVDNKLQQILEDPYQITSATPLWTPGLRLG